ncbi:uncharacterized protein PRCAT00002378001 [Priceomyces carsonii]|uniref:uncharacterized protein n=1 Tax=Priceomyces carsonii TaxID=28549 RepID=UPI002ED84618|nr:unnamed protein product [Priceomyces carsonii]
MTLPISLDDTFIPNKTQTSFNENIDYMSNGLALNNLHLYQCWKQNNSVSIKSSNDDISFIIPSTVSKRLENVCWRRWFKNLCNLSEISPAHINWCKDQDITWLYGPKYEGSEDFEIETNKERSEVVSKREGISIPKLSCSSGNEDIENFTLSSSIDSGRSSITYEVSTSSSTGTVENFLFHSGVRSALKKSSSMKKNKSVKFNYIINSREIINSMHFDYHFLDGDCL